MAKQILIATHAALAKGFTASLEFIFAPQDKIHTICAFTEEEDPGKAFDELFSTFSPEDTVIVCTDLGSGSVNKMIASRLSDKRFYLVTGINLALLLELSCTPEDMINETFIRKAIENCQKDMQFVNDLVTGAENDTEESFF